MTEPIVVNNSNTLREAVLAAISKYGPSVDLNHIDVGGVDNFDGLFKDTEFCGDVSQWNMAQAKSTNYMFAGTPFNGDLSKWNMACLEKARGMFKDSLFNRSIAHWQMGSILIHGYIHSIFENAAFAQDLTDWHLSDKRENIELRIEAMAKAHRPTRAVPTNQDLREHSMKAYITLFGGENHLHKYLARTPFGVMHFDVCCVSKSCPAGVSVEDFQWSRELLLIGNGLGLDNLGIRALCIGNFETRNQRKIVESFSLDGFSSQH